MIGHREIEAAIKQHLDVVWPNRGAEPFVWTLAAKKPSIQIYRVEPLKPGEPWMYASCGAWQFETREDARYEFVLLSPRESPSHIETLAMLANFHSAREYGVEPGKIVNIGRPWMDGATCDHLLVSVPYPLGPKAEYLEAEGSSLTIRFLWLLPITSGEAAFAREHGVEALEQKFESVGVNYLDEQRKTVL